MSDEPIKRILAVDYGDKRTGLAATDWTGTICVTLPRIDESDRKRLCKAIAEVVSERETQHVVVGMPLAPDGGAGQRAQHTQKFVDALAAHLAPLPVSSIDESHTTDEAHERLKNSGLKAAKRKTLADSMSALVILERFRGQA